MQSAGHLQEENTVLQAFLDAFPGEYCGFSKSDHVIYSPGFIKKLGLETIRSIADIQAALSPSDAAALEGMLERLKKDRTAFELNVMHHDEEQAFKISGTTNAAPQGEDNFVILWIEDKTKDHIAQKKRHEQKRETQHEFNKLQIALDSIPRPVWLRDPDQNLIWVNNRYCEYLEADRDHIVETQSELISTTSASKENVMNGRDLAKNALAQEQAAELSVHSVFNGKRLWLKLSEIPLSALGMTLGFAYNNTREDELQTLLDRAKASHEELLEQLGSGIAIFDSMQNLEFYNTSYARMWGLESGWLNTKPSLSDIMEKLRETRKLPEQADFRGYKKTYIDMFTNLIKPHEEMMYLPSGNALRMLIVPHSMGGLMMNYEDVTSRLELESSYNTLIAVQKETLDNLAEAVAVFGSNGRLKLWNPQYAQMWDLHPEDLDDTPHINALMDRKRSYFKDSEWPSIKEKLISYGLSHSTSQDRLSRMKNGKNSLINLSSVPLPDGGVLITYTDVTSTVEIENALREKASALEAAEQLKLDFLANVSYQLRTPLSSIMGFADMLSQQFFGPLNKKQQEYTADIHTASEKLLALINDILDLSTLEAGYLVLEREEFKIKEMLGDVEELVGNWAMKEKLHLTMECPANIGSLTADRRRLKQALVNLVRNAINFTPEDGNITIKASRKKEAIHFTVTDTGVGIPEDQKQRIFAPFERAQKGNTVRVMRSGAGIGLTLVQRIAEAHEGQISIQSQKDKGTIAELIVPLTSTKTNLKIPAQKAAAASK